MNLRKTGRNVLFFGFMAGLLSASYEMAGRDILHAITMQRPHKEYLFPKDTLNGDTVSFEITRDLYSGDLTNVLRVAKPDGKVLRFIDSWDNDLDVDALDTEREYFYKPSFFRRSEIMESAQVSFDNYLKDIKQRKLEQALESIR